MILLGMHTFRRFFATSVNSDSEFQSTLYGLKIFSTNLFEFNQLRMHNSYIPNTRGNCKAIDGECFRDNWTRAKLFESSLKCIELKNNMGIVFLSLCVFDRRRLSLFYWIAFCYIPHLTRFLFVFAFHLECFREWPMIDKEKQNLCDNKYPHPNHRHKYITQPFSILVCSLCRFAVIATVNRLLIDKFKQRFKQIQAVENDSNYLFTKTLQAKTTGEYWTTNLNRCSALSHSQSHTDFVRLKSFQINPTEIIRAACEPYSRAHWLRFDIPFRLLVAHTRALCCSISCVYNFWQYFFHS